jgi:hypothetical protein
MGIVHVNTHRRRTVLLMISGTLALLTVLVIAWAAAPHNAAAQISPLSPLTVATPVTESQPQTATPDAASPAPSQADNDSLPARNMDQPLIPLGEPAQAQPSMILIGALLVGLVVFVIVVAVARRRE